LRTSAGTGTREGYGQALAELWERLGRAMSDLDALAATPAEQLLEEAGPLLPRLQYDLHLASETALGLTPPPESEQGHEELAQALVLARDATAELLDAVEAGDLEAAAGMTYEWRGALFAVRLARLRLTAADRSAAFFERIEHRSGFRRTAVATGLLVALALAAIVAGSVAGLSPAVAGAVVLLAAAGLAARA
jgi:hypothetical protein